MSDTIHALASAPGKSGVAVTRLSGRLAFEVAASLMGSLPAERMASVRVLRDTAGEVIDEALVIVFGEGSSFTGEPTVEFQTHGSMAVVARLASSLSGFPGVRPAEAGEFTRRALENDRLSLLQVEGLADLIDAETDLQRQQALVGFTGRSGELIQSWREDLIRAASLLEAVVDFGDEDVPVDVSDDVRFCLNRFVGSARKELGGVVAAARVKSGFEVAIIGSPNVGKSTLLNYIAGRDVAITSDIAGTTRDVIEVRVDLSGMAVTFLDTAGLRETSDVVEGLGVSRARRRAEEADLRIVLLGEGEEVLPGLVDGDIVVQGKSDVSGGEGVSGVTGEGVAGLLARVEAVLSERVSDAGVLSWGRHEVRARNAVCSVERAFEQLEFGPDNYVLVSEEVRAALRQLDGLIGKVDVEDLLDSIFLSFCIGK